MILECLINHHSLVTLLIESSMLGQWDSKVREFIILAGEWVKGCIMESKVIGSLIRRIT